MPRLMSAITHLPMSLPKRRPMTRSERTAVRAMAFATDEFEPYPAFVIRAPILRSLIDLGLVECGSSNRPAVASQGFRLTTIGMGELRKVWRGPVPEGALLAP